MRREQSCDKIVRMIRFDAERRQHGSRKIFDIESDDADCFSLNSRSQNVTIIFIRQQKRFNQMLIAGHNRVGNCTVHHLTRSDELRRLNIRPRIEQILGPLVVNCLRPTRSEQSCHSQRHQSVTQRGGVKHTSIVDYGKVIQALNNPNQAPELVLAVRPMPRKTRHLDALGKRLDRGRVCASEFRPEETAALPRQAIGRDKNVTRSNNLQPGLSSC